MNPRFSLLSFVLGTLVVALAIALWVNGRKLDPLRKDLQTAHQQIRDLQQQLGKFPDVDPTLMQAMRVQNPKDDRWRYRVYLPTANKYYLHAAHGHIPVSGLPSGWRPSSTVQWQVNSGSWQSGEFTVDVSIAKVGDEWTYEISRLSQPNRQTTRGGLGEDAEWLGDRRSWITSGSVEVLVQVPEDQPLILLRLHQGVAKMTAVATAWFRQQRLQMA